MSSCSGLPEDRKNSRHLLFDAKPCPAWDWKILSSVHNQDHFQADQCHASKSSHFGGGLNSSYPRRFIFRCFPFPFILFTSIEIATVEQFTFVRLKLRCFEKLRWKQVSYTLVAHAGFHFAAYRRKKKTEEERIWFVRSSRKRTILQR